VGRSLVVVVSAIDRDFCRIPQASGHMHGFQAFATRRGHGRKPDARDSIANVSPTPFEVQSEALNDGIHVFTVYGELDLDTAPQLLEPLEKTLSEGSDLSLVLDLSPCEFIDSTGIALIVQTWKRVDSDAGGEGQGRVVLCCSNDQVQRLLKITGVESSISTFGDRDRALAELRG
jgi:anti-anti-sigma factor